MAVCRPAVLVSLSALLFLGSSQQLPDISDPQFVQSCVQIHNTLRSQAQPPATGMRYMTWDEALAKSARSWAKKCQASHNPLLKQAGRLHPAFQRVGENIWAGLPASSFSVRKALNSWDGEKQHYTLKNNSCGKTCGHYTQLMWAKSFKVGCAVHPCTGGITGFTDSPTAVIFVCNYGEGYVHTAPQLSYLSATTEKEGTWWEPPLTLKDHHALPAQKIIVNPTSAGIQREMQSKPMIGPQSPQLSAFLIGHLLPNRANH